MHSLTKDQLCFAGHFFQSLPLLATSCIAVTGTIKSLYSLRERDVHILQQKPNILTQRTPSHPHPYPSHLLNSRVSYYYVQKLLNLPPIPTSSPPKSKQNKKEPQLLTLTPTVDMCFTLISIENLSQDNLLTVLCVVCGWGGGGILCCME